MTATHRIPRIRQQGGTVTGLIIGLIIGLVIAVWVATTIMKTPLPFVDKIGKQTQPAGDLGDPNKTLPGGARERRERMEDSASDAPAAAPAGKKNEAPATSGAVSSSPTSSVPAAQPAAERARAEKASVLTPPATSVTPAPAAADKAAADKAGAGTGERFTYYLQAGAFREQQDAEATKAKLALMGVAATIAERKSDLGTLYRVRIGPFAEIEAMTRTRARISDNGVDAAVVPVPK